MGGAVIILGGAVMVAIMIIMAGVMIATIVIGGMDVTDEMVLTGVMVAMVAGNHQPMAQGINQDLRRRIMADAVGPIAAIGTMVVSCHRGAQMLCRHLSPLCPKHAQNPPGAAMVGAVVGFGHPVISRIMQVLMQRLCSSPPRGLIQTGAASGVGAAKAGLAEMGVIIAAAVGSNRPKRRRKWVHLRRRALIRHNHGHRGLYDRIFQEPEWQIQMSHSPTLNDIYR
jgi:hypothetical protein